jgi:outer membrane lipoprotein SlyB
MENRRDFFKAVGVFAAGVVGAKIASYTPKKQEEELQVAESVIVKDKDGKEYNMVVVPKKEEPAMPKSSSFDSGERFRISSSGNAIIGHHVPEAMLTINQNKKPRKLNV